MTKTARSTQTTTKSEELDGPEVATLAAVAPDPPSVEMVEADGPANAEPITLEGRLGILEQKLFELSLNQGGQIAELSQFMNEARAKQAAGFPVRVYIDAVCQYCGLRLNSPGITGAATDTYQHPWEPSNKLNNSQCPHKGKKFNLAELFLTEVPAIARRNS